VSVNKAKVLKDAQKFIAKGQFEKAIVEFEKLLKVAPNDTNTHNSIGDLYLKKGDKDKAIPHFTKAAELLNKDGFTLKAIALYKKVLNINPEQVDVLLVMGKLNAERGMVGNANDNLLAAAAYFTKKGKRDRVLEVYKSLCSINPDSTHMQHKLAELYLAEGHENEAAAKFVLLAEKKIESSDYNEARQLLNKAVGKGTERSDYMRVSALIDISDGRLPEALEKLTAARDANPDNVKVLTLLGDVYLKTGEYEMATDVLKSILKADPENSEVQKKLIEISLKNGDFGSAWEGYKGLIEACIDRREFDKAEKLLKEYTGHDQKSIEARLMLADLYGNIGREDKVTVLQLVIAELYAEKGETDRAKNICATLLKKEPDNEDIKETMSRLSSPAGRMPQPQPEPEFQPEPEPEAVPSLEDTGFEISGEHELPAADEVLVEDAVPEEAGLSLDAPFEGMEDLPVQDEIPSEPGAESPFGGFDEPECGAVPEDAGMEPGGGEELGGFGLDQAAEDLSEENDIGGFGETGGGGADSELFSGGLETMGFDERPDEPESDFIADTPFSTYDEPAPDVEQSGQDISEPSFSEEETFQEEEAFQEEETFQVEEEDISSPEMQLGGFEPEPEPELEEDTSGNVFDLGDAAEELSTINLQDVAESVSETFVQQVPEEPSAEQVGEMPAVEKPSSDTLAVSEEPASFEERLTEVDVYVKYGLFPKAKETLGALSATHPNNPEIARRRLDISKAEGDIESYATHALDLGGIYYSKGMEEEALEVLKRASQLCPGDERITRKLEALQGASVVQPAQPEPPARVEVPAPSVPDEVSFAEVEAEPEEVSFAGLDEEESSFAGLGEEGAGEEDEALADSMSEAEFYAQQGLVDEALGIYRRILAANPEYGEARQRYDDLMAKAAGEQEEGPAEVMIEEVSVAPSGEKADDDLDVAFSEFDETGLVDTLEPEAGIPLDSEEPELAAVIEEDDAEEEEVLEGDDFFDLAAELRDEIGADAGKQGGGKPAKESIFGDEALDAAFEEFKRGVEDQIGAEDYETHYNLGIAYKEMGMLDDALAEFSEASRDPSRSLDCASMLALCHIEKGEYATAIEYFKKGLRVAGRTREEYLGVKYDMATAYELNGDVASAQSLVNDVFREDKSFRDVKKRLQRLNKQLIDAGGVPDGSGDTAEAESPQQKPQSKNNKVSYL